MGKPNDGGKVAKSDYSKDMREETEWVKKNCIIFLYIHIVQYCIQAIHCSFECIQSDCLSLLPGNTLEY